MVIATVNETYYSGLLSERTSEKGGIKSLLVEVITSLEMKPMTLDFCPEEHLRRVELSLY